MEALFSQRHKSWIYDVEKRKKNKLSFDAQVRVSVSRILNEHSRHEAYEDNYEYNAEYTDLGLEHMKTVLGVESFTRNDWLTKEKYIDMNMLDLIKHGYPSDILDCIEAYLFCVKMNNDQICYCIQKELNNIFKIHNSYWRFIEMRAVLIDSSYISEEIIAVQNDHLRKLGANGVLDEFRTALDAFQLENYKTTIQESQKSLESAIKTVIRDDSPANSGDLIKKLRSTKILPSQYIGFTDNLFKLIQTVNAGRSQPGGAHGQGSQILDIDRNEAELILNLTAVFNKYLAELYIQQDESSTISTPKINAEVLSFEDDDSDDLPF